MWPLKQAVDSNGISSGKRQINQEENEKFKKLLMKALIVALILTATVSTLQSLQETEILSADFADGLLGVVCWFLVIQTGSGLSYHTLATILCSTSTNALRILLARIPAFQTIYLNWSRRNMPEDIIPPTAPCGTKILEKYSRL